MRKARHTGHAMLLALYFIQDANEQAGLVSEAHTLLDELEARLDSWETRKLLNGIYDDRWGTSAMCHAQNS